MVHYDPETLKLAQTPPPVCPRCGSHRTEIVGLSDDGRTMTVRCNACGERSRIETAGDATAARTAACIDADGSDELDVMRSVGRALAHLPDAASRTRVLNWASDRFGLATLADADVDQARLFEPPRVADHRDLALSVDGMEALFSDHTDTKEVRSTRNADRPGEADRPARPVVPERLESLVEGFVNDFQRVATAWQSV